MPRKAESLEVRFWRFVDKTPGLGKNGDCWEWRGSRRGGYGKLRLDSKVRNINIRAHRAAWLIHYGTMPTNDVCHHCDNPLCVRWDHLFDGTDSANRRDAIAKGRAHIYKSGPDHLQTRKTHCPAGHLYNDANTYHSLTERQKPTGTKHVKGRSCRICNRVAVAKYRAKKMAQMGAPAAAS
jgi:hypothetical protein